MALNRWAAATATLAATIMLALGIWGYLQYQNSQRGLQSYMDQYIEMRSVTERIHSRQLLRVEANSGVSEADAAVIEENPFAVGSNPFTHTQNVSFNNPFRTEER